MRSHLATLLPVPDTATLTRDLCPATMTKTGQHAVTTFLVSPSEVRRERSVAPCLNERSVKLGECGAPNREGCNSRSARRASAYRGDVV
jgi:hypothetical protein